LRDERQPSHTNLRAYQPALRYDGKGFYASNRGRERMPTPTKTTMPNGQWVYVRVSDTRVVRYRKVTETIHGVEYEHQVVKRVPGKHRGPNESGRVE
jgi:hypothetical protein